MANFTALKTAINNAIKTNGNEEITGAVLQVILDAMVETLGESAITNLENAITTEVSNRENAVGGVADDLAAEVQARQALDYNVNNRINAEEYNRQNADAALSQTMNQGFQTLDSQMNALNAAISALNAAYQNGFLYGGIVTPSSSPSNGKCFYIALQGGTYTNFGGVGVVEGINIIKNDSGWKVEHIYDQTTLLNEFYLLRQQVIQAITSFAPTVIQGDVTNAPDEEDLTSNDNHLLQFKNNAYSPLEFSGLGRKYLRKNIAPLSESAPFNGFVEGVTAEETLSGTPTQIFWDRMNTRFVGIKDGVYYLDWTDSDNYVPVSTSLVYMYNGTPYQWTGSDFVVDETEVPNLVNCLTQDMINEANTIYIIRYDYTLKENITIPANCVLQFDGGSISNGIITLNNTSIISAAYPIFKNVEFNYTDNSNLCINDVLFDWFAGNNAYIDLRNATRIAKKLVFSYKDYHFYKMDSASILVDHDITIECNGCTWILESTFLNGINSNGFLYHNKILDVKNLNIVVNTTNQKINEDTCKQVLMFTTGYRFSNYGSEQAAYLDNVNIDFRFADSGIATLYNAYLGYDFIIKNCTVNSAVPNTGFGGGGFAWFMLGNDDNKNVNIKITDCNIITPGNDEPIAVSTSNLEFGTSKKVINAIISNNTIRNLYDKSWIGAPLLNIDTFKRSASDNKVELNVFVENCNLVRENTIGVRCLSIATAKNYGVTANVTLKDCYFEYKGDSPFDYVNQEIQNGDGIIITFDYTSDVKDSNIRFLNCIFKGKNLFCTKRTLANVTFTNCKIECVDLTGAKEQQPLYISKGNTTFENCYLHFGHSIQPCGIYGLSFIDCNMFVPDDYLRFQGVGHPTIKLVKNSRINNLNIPSPEIPYLGISPGTNIMEYSGMFSFASYGNEDENFVMSWYNSLGKTVIIKNAVGEEFSVADGEMLIQELVYRGADRKPAYVPLTIDGVVYKIWCGSLKEYNSEDTWLNFSRGTTTNRPKGIASNHSYRGGLLEPTLGIGYNYFDTSIHKLIVADSIVNDTGDVTWVDTNGATV